MVSNNGSNEIEGYDLFKEKIQKEGVTAEQDAPTKPLEVTSVSFESMTEEQRKEQEAVYKALEDKYCICNHKKDKHHVDVGFCKYQATRFWQGRVETFKCECPSFKSRKQQREEIEANA